jgi:hypothetical protein
MPTSLLTTSCTASRTTGAEKVQRKVRVVDNQAEWRREAPAGPDDVCRPSHLLAPTPSGACAASTRSEHGADDGVYHKKPGAPQQRGDEAARAVGRHSGRYQGTLERRVPGQPLPLGDHGERARPEFPFQSRLQDARPACTYAAACPLAPQIIYAGRVLKNDATPLASFLVPVSAGVRKR